MTSTKALWIIAAALFLAAPTAQAQTGVLEAESLTIEGSVESLELRYLRSIGVSEDRAPAANSMRISGSDVRVEAWYEDSKGYPVRVLPETEIQVLADGRVDATGIAVRPVFEVTLQSAHGAPASLPPSFRLKTHAQEQRTFPDYVAPTGEEPIVDVADDAAATLASRGDITVHAPFTLTAWAWNFTLNGDPEAAWSGERSHGPDVGGRHPQGLDRQLLVFHVQEGMARFSADPAMRIQELFVTDDEFRLNGKLTAHDARLSGATDGPEDRSFEGLMAVRAQRLDNDTLETRIQDLDPGRASGPLFPGSGGVDGQTTTADIGADPPAVVLIGIGIAAVLAVAGWLGLRALQWRHLKGRFAEGDFRHVARRAGRFHDSRLRGGDAQVMTIVAALKLGHFQLALDSLPAMPAIERRVSAMLEGHALIGLDRLDEAQALLERMRQQKAPTSEWTDALDAPDDVAAYT